LHRAAESAKLGRVERARVEQATSEASAPAPLTAAGAVPLVLTPATALVLQRTIGNANVARLARAPRAAVAREPATAIPALSSDWDDISTYTDAAQNYRLGALWLQEDIEGLDPESDLAVRAQELIDDSQAYAKFYIDGGDKEINELFIDGVRQGLDDIRQMRRDIEWAKGAPRREAIRQAAAEAQRVAEEYRKLEPKLLDAARAAFRSDDDSLTGLADFLDKRGTELDVGLGIFEMSRDISGALMKAGNLELPPIGKFAEGLGKLNKGLTALNLALSLRGESGRTELDKGVKGIGIAAGMFSGLGTLLGASAHIGLYANLYLVPLTKACLEGVAKLGEHMHEQNKTWVEAFGAPGNYMVEPGGEPMWRYMTSVMKATSSKTVAEPPDDVAAYFFEHRAKLNIGVNAKSSLSELPISGIYGFREVDKEKFKSWIFNNRNAVWPMLYGSMKTGKG
jgi:hypothetical protein